jgi:hypothetical protein
MSEEEHRHPIQAEETQEAETSIENLDMAAEAEEPTEAFVEEQEQEAPVVEEMDEAAVEEDEVVAAARDEEEKEEPSVMATDEEEKACADGGTENEESCNAEEAAPVVLQEEEEEELKVEPPPVIDAPPGCCGGCSGESSIGAKNNGGSDNNNNLFASTSHHRPPFTVVLQDLFLNGDGYVLKNPHKWIETSAMVLLLYACIFGFFWTRRNCALRQALAKRARQQQQDEQENSAESGNGGGSTSKEAAAMQAATSSNPAATGFSFPMTDLVYVADLLTPDSTHMDIIYALISSPQVLLHSCAALEHVYEIKQKKLQQQALDEKKKKKDTTFSSLVEQEDGWGDDDDGDDDNDQNMSEETRQAERKAKEEERQKKLHMERLKAATGQALPLLEGMDEGVLGQQWVEATLGLEGQWPPPAGLGVLEGKTFEYKDPATGKVSQLSALDHPGLRRNLCMTAGRLNSIMLNTHADLIQAGQDKLIDQSYFKGAMEFRMRIIVLLEQSLRVALTLRSYTLFATMVECIALFKIGCVPGTGLPWFNGHMARTYGTLPRLSIGQVIFTKHVKTNKADSTAQQQQQPNNSGPAEIIPTDTIVAGQTAAVVLPVERTHAEKFTRTKLEQWKKQGIPPQVAMNSYREGWWFLLRCERLDKNDNEASSSGSSSKKKEALNTEDGAKVLSKVHPNTVQRFNATAPEFYLVTAWPMIVQNIGQKSGAVKISVTAPDEPGRYRFHVGIQSQDFLGADQVVSVDITVVDGNPTPTIQEGEEEEEDEDDDDDDDDEIHEVD